MCQAAEPTTCGAIATFRGTLRWSVAIGVVSVVTGLAAARIWDLAPSGIIVLVAAGIFAVVALAKRSTVPRLRTEGSRP